MKETPTVESNFVVVVAGVRGEQELQRRNTHKFVCKSKRNPFLSFLTGERIQALSISASAVNDDTIASLKRLASLQYVIVLGDGERSETTNRLRSVLADAEIFGHGETVDSQPVIAGHDLTTQAKEYHFRLLGLTPNGEITK